MTLTPFDAWCLARSLANRPLNRETSRASPEVRSLIDLLAGFGAEERSAKLSSHLASTMSDLDRAAFAEAIHAVDPDDPEPQDEPWPKPLIDGPEPGEPFPLDVLPPELASLARQGAEAFGCPVDYFAAPALVLAGGAAGRSVELRINSTWTEAADLSLAVVGPPGSKKSPPLRMLLQIFYNFDRKLRDDYLKEKDRYKHLLREWEVAKKKGGEVPDEPSMPTHGHVTLDDTTREAVARIHSENPRGVILALDELSSWVASLNAYRSGKGDDRQFWLKVRSGSPVKVTRKGSPEPLVIPRPMIPVVGCLTPSSLPEMAQGRDDGWLDRILFAYPEAGDSGRGGYIDKELDPELLRSWEAAVRRLYERPMTLDQDGGHPRPFLVRLTDPARSAWASFVDAHHAEQRAPGFDETLCGPWSKLEGFTLRLALIVSLLHWAYDATTEGSAPNVRRQDIKGAVRLAAYFKSSFRRVKADLSGMQPPEAEDGKAVLRWAAEDGRACFTANEVNEKLGRFRGDLKRRDAALAWLQSRCAIRHTRPSARSGAGRKPSPLYEINPRIRHSGNSGNPRSQAETGHSLNFLNAKNEAGPDQGEEGEDA